MTISEGDRGYGRSNRGVSCWYEASLALSAMASIVIPTAHIAKPT